MRRFLLVAVVAACGPAEYEPYEGDAFPNANPALASGVALVTDSLSDTISEVDLATGETLFSYPIGRDPVATDGPHHVVVDPAGGYAYVPLSYPVEGVGPHGGHGASTRLGYLQMLSLTDLSLVGQVRVDLNPGDVAIHPDGSRVFVSHFDLVAMTDNPDDVDAARTNLAIVDGGSLLPSGSPEPTFVKVCMAAHGIALLPSGRVALACYGEDALAIVDVDLGQVDALVPVGPGAQPYTPQYGPYAIAVSPDGSELAVSNTESDDVRFFDVATGAFDEALTLTTFGSPRFAIYSADGASLVVPTQTPDGISVFDLATGTEVQRRDFAPGECGLPHQVEWESGDLLVVCEGDHEGPGALLRLDAASLDTKMDTPVGVFPDKVLVLP